jgi:hypothetical protein
MEKINFYFSISIALVAIVICYWLEWELLKFIFVKFLPWLWGTSLGRDVICNQFCTAIFFFILKTY